MTDQKVRPKSGDKIINDVGVKAIKNGQKRRTDEQAPRGDKPKWLRFVSPGGQGYQDVKKIVRTHRLSTVCEEAMCPNIGECWSAGTATIMLMGSVCTRACQFCAVDTGNPKGWLDLEEPQNTAESVALMGLKYVVLTSVNRDDLADGGANHFAATVRAIKQQCPETAVEALTPDFQGLMTGCRSAGGFGTGGVCAKMSKPSSDSPTRSVIRELVMNKLCKCSRTANTIVLMY